MPIKTIETNGTDDQEIDYDYTTFENELMKASKSDDLNDLDYNARKILEIGQMEKRNNDWIQRRQNFPFYETTSTTTTTEIPKKTGKNALNENGDEMGDSKFWIVIGLFSFLFILALMIMVIGLCIHYKRSGIYYINKENFQEEIELKSFS